MRDWTDKDLGALLAEVMTAHEDDVEPARAHLIAQDAMPTRRRWPLMVGGTAAAVALIVAVPIYLSGRSPDNTAEVPPGPATTGPTTATATSLTTAENRVLAIAASKAAVTSLPLPDDAARLDAEPDGWPRGGVSLGPSDDTLTETAWWSVPGTPEELADFLTSNAPEGMQHEPGTEVVVNGTSDGVGYTDYEQIELAMPAAYTGPSVLVQFKQFEDRTVVRVDTFLAARAAVSPQHRITASVTSVTIERIRPDPPIGADDGGPLPTVTLTSPADLAAINSLVRGFNGLYGTQIPVPAISCPFPGDPPPEDTVTFATDAGPVVAHVEPWCFGQVQVTVGGEKLSVTLDPGSWSQLVDVVADEAE